MNLASSFALGLLVPLPTCLGSLLRLSQVGYKMDALCAALEKKEYGVSWVPKLKEQQQSFKERGTLLQGEYNKLKALGLPGRRSSESGLSSSAHCCSPGTQRGRSAKGPPRPASSRGCPGMPVGAMPCPAGFGGRPPGAPQGLHRRRRDREDLVRGLRQVDEHLGQGPQAHQVSSE